ncbi:MAG: NTP transferase domain-containing protein [Saccharofermentans sp.]|nr:NTP transferase domain-containing protein [Saccharofermentans sp.]
MIALILNSGLGKRMGSYTKEHPKCMTEITDKDTIISRQLRLLAKMGIRGAVITTGPFTDVFEDYVRALDTGLDISFVNNPIYDKTNYIYSIYMARELLDDDILLMHGDLVFDETVLEGIYGFGGSCVAVSSTLALPEKDFKAVIEGGKVTKVGIEFFDNAMACQPLYRLDRKDWKIWLDAIVSFCEAGTTSCYAENALNLVADKTNIIPYDVKDTLCGEIDNEEDLMNIRARLGETL